MYPHKSTPDISKGWSLCDAESNNSCSYNVKTSAINDCKLIKSSRFDDPTRKLHKGSQISISLQLQLNYMENIWGFVYLVFGFYILLSFELDKRYSFHSKQLVKDSIPKFLWFTFWPNRNAYWAFSYAWALNDAVRDSASSLEISSRNLAAKS